METENVIKQRPVFLTIICIISFAGLGIIMMKNLFALALSQLFSTLVPVIKDGMQQALNEVSMSNPPVQPFLEKVFSSVIKLLSNMPLFAGLTFAISGVALAGVILMWNQRKSGFYMYSVAKILGIFLPVMIIGVNFISMMMGASLFIVAAIFITLYALNLKSME